MYAIAAVDSNWGIGKEGNQFVYLSPDLKRFKTLTTGHPLILGRKTLATFPGGRPLSGRRNLILSHNIEFSPSGAEVFHSVDQLLDTAPADSFVIGGGSVYQALLPYCHTVYLTQLEGAWPADTWFPRLDQHPHWMVSHCESWQEHEGLRFRYVIYRNSAV